MYIVVKQIRAQMNWRLKETSAWISKVSMEWKAVFLGIHEMIKLLLTPPKMEGIPHVLSEGMQATI